MDLKKLKSKTNPPGAKLAQQISTTRLLVELPDGKTSVYRLAADASAPDTVVVEQHGVAVAKIVKDRFFGFDGAEIQAKKVEAPKPEAAKKAEPKPVVEEAPAPVVEEAPAAEAPPAAE